VKAGKNKLNKQKYLCKDCGCRFISWKPFHGMRFSGEIIAQAIYAYQVKQSLRDVQRFLLHTFQVDVTWRTIKNWIEKYLDPIKEFLSKFKCTFSGMWHADEVFITWDVRDPDNRHEVIKNEKYYCWFVLDANSRFLVYPEYSTERTYPSAIKILKKARALSKTVPQCITTDSLAAYNIAIRKVLYPVNRHIQHLDFTMIKGEHGNNLIERCNRTIRQRIKLYIGYRPKGNSTKILDMFITYYNFIKPHQSLKNKTPAEVAGLDLGLEHNQYGFLKLMKTSLIYVHKMFLKDKKRTVSAFSY
jgi:transposase-like protein